MKYQIYELVPAVTLEGMERSLTLREIYIPFKTRYDTPEEAELAILSKKDSLRFKDLVILPTVRYDYDGEEV